MYVISIISLLLLLVLWSFSWAINQIESIERELHYRDENNK